MSFSRCGAIWFLVAIAANIFIALQVCPLDETCLLQIPGHWYPATFMLFLGCHAERGAASAQTVTGGMIAFGIVYVLLDVVGHGGDLSFLEREKPRQHWVFTLTISAFGMIRALVVRHRGAMFEGDADTLILATLSWLMMIFMANHPQPNAVGNLMHTVSSVYIAAFCIFGTLGAPARAKWSMIFATVCFISSQEGLTKAAVAANIDQVAYCSLVHTAALLAVLLSSHTIVPKSEKLPVTTAV